MISHHTTSSYFGYGSLVNRHTRPPGTQTEPFRLTGWIRQWRHCLENPFTKVNVYGNICALTVERRPGSTIDGVLVLADVNELTSIDSREIGYHREAIDAGQNRNAYIYVSNDAYHRWASDACPIWRSYVDCVLAGYLEVFGRDGAERFIASTEGWDRAAILDDREEPKYPRAVKLTPAEASVIDQLLTNIGITFP